MNTDRVFVRLIVVFYDTRQRIKGQCCRATGTCSQGDDTPTTDNTSRIVGGLCAVSRILA